MTAFLLGLDVLRLSLIFFPYFILNVQKHKERERHKPRHKKSMDMSPSLVLPNILIPDKVSATPVFFVEYEEG